ncbi:MAG: TlpA disulfide reductase family protein [Candidatus Kapabacteria bacterium]|jgi:thiol-disulfide isomerase/thioredoxin|nr:TlpA disulfide reductase family protein [Candidatus Kapabacteria bacterium]
MLKRLFSLLTLTIILASCGEEAKINTVHGSLLSCENQPMQAANVEAYIFNSKIDTVKISTDSDGKFELEFDQAEMIAFNFFGADHMKYKLTLYTTGISESFDLKVNLQANSLPEEMNDVRVIGNFNHFDFEEGVSMTLQSDGTYEAIVPNDTDTLFYQLLGITSGGMNRSVNGTSHDFLVYDGGGDYRSAVITNDKEVKIVFNPIKKHYPDTKYSATSTNELINDYISSHNDLIKKYNESFTGLHEAMAEGNKEKIKAVFSAGLSTIGEMIKVEKDKRILSDQIFTYCEINETAARFHVNVDHDPIVKSIILKELPVNSNIWIGNYVHIPSALLIVGSDQALDLLKKFQKGSLSDKQKVNIFANSVELFSMTENEETCNSILEMMETFYPEERATKLAGIEFGDKGLVKIGNQVPEFSSNSLDNPKEIISSESIKGKYTLIDIWAVWCSPCRGEMEHLHAAYEKYKDKNFQMLSISFDKTINDVQKYRAGKWKMPWSHIFATGAFSGKIGEAFEVRGIPKPLLIDPDGKILALSPGLRGDALLETLAKYLD